MSKQTDFIHQIAPLVQKIAPEFGIDCCSAVIAQACLESAFGTSNKAKYHNYFGLKYRAGRLTCDSGTFVDGSSEQNADGSRYDITDSWYKFDTMENGVRGYFQFIDIPNYANTKGVADPEIYLGNIRADGYATSLDYVKNVMAVVDTYGLSKYDTVVIGAEKPSGIKINRNTGFLGYNVTVGRQTPKYIVVHYVGAAGTAANNVAYFNGGNRSASADFFVDENGIWQYNPDIDRQYSWHCGGGRQSDQGGEYFGICTNANSIGIEMCCYQTGNVWAFREATVNNCVELVKHLMQIYRIPALNVIRHYDVTGKYCPWVPGWIPPTGSEVKWKIFKERIAGTSLTDNIVEIISETNFSYPTIKKGSTGSAVKVLQEKLGVVVDGDFGPKTEAAVNAFQKKNGLVVDGICGPLTWAKINSVKEAPKPKWVGKVIATILNVRTGPGTAHPYLSEYPQLAKGNLIDVCDTVDGWYYVRIAGKYYGYVYSDYVTRA